MFKKIKIKRNFIFRKSHLDIKENNLIDYSYKTITDSFIILKANEIAKKYNCKIISFIKDE